MKTIYGTVNSDLHIRTWGKSGNNKRNKDWVKVFEEWASSIKKYYDFTEGDLTWWYTERANISIIAGAVWLSGGIAMEEYSIEKVKGRDEGLYKGRADLYLNVGKEAYAIEGKFDTFSLNHKDIKIPWERITDKLKTECKNDIVKVDEESDFKGGLVMARIEHPADGKMRTYYKNYNKAIKDYRNLASHNLKKEYRFGYRIDFFPSWVKLEDIETDSKNYVYPGMTILLGFNRN